MAGKPVVRETVVVDRAAEPFIETQYFSIGTMPSVLPHTVGARQIWAAGGVIEP